MFVQAKWVIVALSAVGLNACDLDGLGWHDCDTDAIYSSDWSAYELTLDHTDPRTCPAPLSYSGEKIYAAGYVVDTNPDFSSDALELLTSDLSRISYDIGNFYSDDSGRWVVHHSAYYNAGTGSDPTYDIADYEMLSFIHLADASGSLPWARVHITYTYP